MTNKQAIHCMKVDCEEAVCEECELYGTVGTDHCFEEACRKAVEALEKQIPKKPINKTKTTNGVAQHYENCHIVVCPSCAGRLKLKSKGNYCDKCGQAIKWE